MVRGEVLRRGLRWSAWALLGAMVMTGWLTGVAALLDPGGPAPAQLHLSGQAHPPVRVRVVTVAREAAPQVDVEPIRKVSDHDRAMRSPHEPCPAPSEMAVQLGPKRWGVHPSAPLCALNHLAVGCGRIVPTFVNGVAEGFKIFPRPDGLLGQLGFRPGDVIRKVNGNALTDPERTLEIYHSATFPLQVELRRRGEVLTHTYELLSSR